MIFYIPNNKIKLIVIINVYSVNFMTKKKILKLAISSDFVGLMQHFSPELFGNLQQQKRRDREVLERMSHATSHFPIFDIHYKC